MSGRLLFLAPSAYPLGGVADWLDYAMAGLRDEGWDCTLGLACGRFHDPGTYLDAHPWPEVIRMRNATGSPEGRMTAIGAAIAEANPDIVAVVNLVEAYEVLRRARRAGRAAPKIVATLHGLQADLLADMEAERDVLDAVVATNLLTCSVAAEAMMQPDRIFYAPYGVPLPVWAGSRRVPVGNRLRLIYSGRVEQEQKRVSDLPAILSRLRADGIDARLSVAGAGPDEALLREAIGREQVGDAVDFLGVLDKAALSAAYREHDALVVASSWETGPIVAWEAMSHGLALLTSRFVGSRMEGALLEGGNCLMFPVGDTAAAAAQAQRLFDAATWRTITEGGHRLVEERYGRQASVQSWLRAFSSISALPPLRMPEAGPLPAAKGRLDSLLGPKRAESVRAMLGREHRHGDAGGEWPHTRHKRADQSAWMRLAEMREGSE